MSKLSKALIVYQTDNVKYEMPSFKFVNFEKEFKNKSSFLKEYTIRTQFKAVVYLDEINPDSQVIERTKSLIIEEIFGEFRPLLNDVEIALYERDFNRAKGALRILREQIFS